ncbi:unnamed protein product [Meloidogyne enterolobii]|uniref:Uncharacterized protein n=1 Tax=Meloidogyne enterolobii TaxID=390850 RepID=A0ACB0YAY4_MELEN
MLLFFLFCPLFFPLPPLFITTLTFCFFLFFFSLLAFLPLFSFAVFIPIFCLLFY